MQIGILNFAIIFFTTNVSYALTPKEHFDESLRAFNEIHSIRRSCDGKDVRILVGLIGGVGLSSAAVTTLGRHLTEGPNSLEGIVSKYVAESDVAQLKNGERVPEKAGNVIRLTNSPGTRQMALNSRKYLLRGGAVGAIFASVLGLAIVATDEQTVTWKEKLIAIAKGLLEEAADGVTGGISETAKDDTVGAMYAKSPKSFLNEFLNLKPDQAKFYLGQSEELQDLMIGYSGLVKVLDTKDEIKNCETTNGDKQVAQTTARAAIAQGQRGSR